VRRRRQPEELERLRRAVREGRHAVDLDRLAEKLVDHELARRAMITAVTGSATRKRRARAGLRPAPRRRH